jgi:hypothetical protein
LITAIPNWTFEKLKGARFRPSFVRFDLFCALADEVWVSSASLGGGLGPAITDLVRLSLPKPEKNRHRLSQICDSALEAWTTAA